MAFTPEFNAWFVIVGVVSSQLLSRMVFLTRFEQRAFVFALDTSDLIYCQVLFQSFVKPAPMQDLHWRKCELKVAREREGNLANHGCMPPELSHTRTFCPHTLWIIKTT